jgi:hypothetical protein
VLQLTTRSQPSLTINTAEDGFDFLKDLIRRAEAGTELDVTAATPSCVCWGRTVKLVDYFDSLDLDITNLWHDYQLGGSPSDPQFLYLSNVTLLSPAGIKNQLVHRIRLTEISTLTL